MTMHVYQGGWTRRRVFQKVRHWVGGSCTATLAAIFMTACYSSSGSASSEETLPLCSAVDSTEEANPISLHIENLRTETVYLQGRWFCGQEGPIELRDADGSVVLTVPNCWSDNGEGCPPAGAYKLPAGGTLDFELAGEQYGEQMCQMEELTEGTRCGSRRVLPNGAYSIHVAWCEALARAGDCTAEADESGCYILGVACAGTYLSASVDLDYPTSEPVVLTIE